MIKQNLIYEEYISNRDLPKNYEPNDSNFLNTKFQKLFQNHLSFQEKFVYKRTKII